jgi:folate-dependent phosphoribosylglycinamide formyltransferase PurN
MKICVISTNEETFFIPKGLKKLEDNFNKRIDIVYVPGFLNLKRLFYSFLSLYFSEFLKIISYKFKNLFKSFNKNEVFKINSINSPEFKNFIIDNNYDLIVSYSCPQIFKKETLDFFEKKNIDIVNFHPGILPKYKGIFLNFFSLKNREEFVGITFHRIIEKIDSGQIMSVFKIPIEKNDTIFSLYEKIYMSDESLKFLVSCIDDYNLIKNNHIHIKNDFKYNSYPKLHEILKYRLDRF